MRNSKSYVEILNFILPRLTELPTLQFQTAASAEFTDHRRIFYSAHIFQMKNFLSSLMCTSKMTEGIEIAYLLNASKINSFSAFCAETKERFSDLLGGFESEGAQIVEKIAELAVDVLPGLRHPKSGLEMRQEFQVQGFHVAAFLAVFGEMKEHFNYLQIISIIIIKCKHIASRQHVESKSVNDV